MINYLLLIHKSPKQLKRLVRALKDCDSRFFIHIDKKCDIGEFRKAVPENDSVFYVTDENRKEGRWGNLSLVEAALATMRLAMNKGGEGHFVLLSGQDYPLRSNEYIKEFLSTHKNSNFMSVYPVPDKKKPSENGGYERFVSWTFDCQNPHDSRMKAKIKPFSFGAKTLGGFFRLALYRPMLLPIAAKAWFCKRKYPEGLGMRFNEFWCVLTKDAVEKVVETYDNRKDLREYYKYMHIPDESMFSSILCETPEFEASLMPMCHYIDWNACSDGSPKTLTMADTPLMENEMETQPYILFARKFEEDNPVLDWIDDKRRRRYDGKD